MNYLIEEQSRLRELEPLFRKLSEQREVVAVDTEFFREKTYRAKLCLVQLGIGDDQYCIDVMAIQDLTALKALFVDENVTKLFHAARQDMEVILQTLGVLPKPIFDTQVAAAFAGLDMQIGYSALVKERLDIDLPKSQARTDWTRRPLSEAQLQYAADDVAHLAELWRLCQQQLVEQGKWEWFQQEIDEYYDVDKYLIDPAKAYQRLSGGSLQKQQQYALKALAEWREATAQKRDIPRSWVLRDDGLFDLAFKLPKTAQEALDLGVFGGKSGQYLAPQAISVIESITVGDEPLWERVEPLTKKEKSIISKMMLKLAEYAQTNHIAQALLGTRKDVESLYRHRKSEKLLKGWRAVLVGEPLMAFLHEQGPGV